MSELIAKKTGAFMPKVYIIILNWNGLKDTLECLDSVYRLDYPHFEVIVVDNCSSDASARSIRQKFPQIIMIENSSNMGFTGGNNIGIYHALKSGGDYVWLLNNDTVVEPTSLTTLVARGESSTEIAMVSPEIYCYLGRDVRQFSGSYVDWKNVEILYPDRVSACEGGFRYGGANVCLWGTALLIKRTTIEAVGYLNSDYFAYWEDTEYSLRTIRAGLQNAMCYDAKIFHKTPIDSSSLPRGSHYYYFMLRNRLFLGKSYLNSYAGKLSFYRKFASNLISSIGACWQAGNIAGFTACLNGTWHGFINKGGAMTADEPMPAYLIPVFKMIAGNHPFLMAALLNFDGTKIVRELRNRCTSWLYKRVQTNG